MPTGQIWHSTALATALAARLTARRLKGLVPGEVIEPRPLVYKTILVIFAYCVTRGACF
jgi:hypothetical protein